MSQDPVQIIPGDDPGAKPAPEIDLCLSEPRAFPYPRGVE